MNDWQDQAARNRTRILAHAMAEREEGRRRLNVATMTVTFASVAAVGAVVAVLPGPTHAAAKSAGSTSPSSSSSSSSGSSSSGSSSSGSSSGAGNSSDGSGNSSPAGSSSSGQGGFQVPANPPQVPAGGGFGSTSGGS